MLPGSGADKILYVVTDHLGSIRVVKDGSGTVRQRFDYYPYGTVSRNWTNSSTTDNSEKRYRFGGKEIAGSSLTDLTGTGATAGAAYLDFGVRLYSPRTATWISPDPLMEKYYGFSPFVYGLDSPLYFIDPDGKDIWRFDIDGHLIDDSLIFFEDNDIIIVMTQNKSGEWEEIEESKIILPYNTLSMIEDDYVRIGVNGKFFGKEAFEIMANNTEVEWSYVSYTDKDYAEIGNSHEYKRNRVLFNSIRDRENLLEEVIHSHNNFPYPSKTDKDLYKQVKNKFPQIPLFQIYYTLMGQYIKYDNSGPIYDPSFYEF